MKVTTRQFRREAHGLKIGETFLVQWDGTYSLGALSEMAKKVGRDNGATYSRQVVGPDQFRIERIR
jgi:hypothetical protein